MKEITLGYKIKEARLAKKMTQNDVVGDYITRNMLSKIENDSAKPSVKTLEYLANKLDVPITHFLSSMVENTGNDEIYINEDKEIHKKNINDRIEMAGDGDEILALYDDYLELLREPSQDDRFYELMAGFFIRHKESEQSIRFIELMEVKNMITGINNHAVNFYKGLIRFNEKKWVDAADIFKKALVHCTDGTQKLELYRLLEKCSIEIQDYKAAYTYAKLYTDTGVIEKATGD